MSMGDISANDSLSPTGGESWGEGASRDVLARPSPGSPPPGRPTLSRNAGEGLSTDIILDVRDLRTYFFLRRGIVKAVDGVSFSLRRGEVLGLVGESGCGKSLTALSIMRLLPRGGARTVGGEVRLNGEDILRHSPREMRAIRGSKISMILQDPQTSLNPVFTIGDQLREALARRLGRRSKTEIIKEA